MWWIPATNYVITMDFKDDSAFGDFLEDIRKRSMYPFPFEVTTDDQIMTMVTCSYEFDGARTIIQSRLRKPVTSPAAASTPAK